MKPFAISLLDAMVGNILPFSFFPKKSYAVSSMEKPTDQIIISLIVFQCVSDQEDVPMSRDSWAAVLRNARTMLFVPRIISVAMAFA
jgi:hypothetical protein